MSGLLSRPLFSKLLKSNNHETKKSSVFQLNEIKTIIMKKITIAILILASTGCTHYYYAPNAANIPLFKEKNTLKLKGGYSGDNYDGADFQLAYSVSKNIGIMVNSFFVGQTEDVYNSINSSSSHKESGKGSYGETGLGYYKPLGKSKVWIFEAYGGAGIGGENHVYDQFQASKLHFTKFFLQPSIGYASKSEHFEVAVSSRFSNLNLKIKNSNLTSQNNQTEKQNLDSISMHPSSVLWEPSFIIAAGGKYVKFYFQLTFSNNLSNPYLAMDNGNLSFGLKITFKNDQKKTNSNNN